MRSKKAFTLIELLVVISIIAMLLSIMMPALSKAKQQAMKIICSANVKSLLLSNDVYAAESKDRYVPAVGGPEMTYTVNNVTGTNPVWYRNAMFANIVGYKDNNTAVKPGDPIPDILPDKYKCKADRRTVENKGVVVINGHSTSVSYGMNRMGLLKRSDASTYGGWNYSQKGGYSFRKADIKGPAKKLFFADGMDYTLWDVCSNYKEYWDYMHDSFWNTNPRFPGYAWDCTSYRHSDGTVAGFFDGHVQWMKKQSVWDLTGTSAQQIYNNAKLWTPLGIRYGDDSGVRP